MRFNHYVTLLVVLVWAFAGCGGCASGGHGPGAGTSGRSSGAQDPGAGTSDRSSGAQDPAAEGRDPASPSLHIPDSLAKEAMNTYIGHLGNGLITVVINYISGDEVSGYALQRGRRRNFNGGAQLRGAELRLELEETGDQPGKFEVGLDTTDWKMTGRFAREGEWRRLEAARRRENVQFENLWVANMTNYHDSVLTFNADGVCEFSFYQRPGDSTSQEITIKGNYERLAGIEKGFKVEWEENAHLSPLNAELKEKEHELTGCGLKLVYFLAPW